MYTLCTGCPMACHTSRCLCIVLCITASPSACCPGQAAKLWSSNQLTVRYNSAGCGHCCRPQRPQVSIGSGSPTGAKVRLNHLLHLPTRHGRAVPTRACGTGSVHHTARLAGLGMPWCPSWWDWCVMQPPAVVRRRRALGAVVALNIYNY